MRTYVRAGTALVAKPDGLIVVPPYGELLFLHPLPVERLWGIGPVTAGKLRERGITTVGQVAASRGCSHGDARPGVRPALARARAQPRPASGARTEPAHTLPQATASTETILTAARSLLAASIATIERRGLTLIGVAVANLDDADAVQLALQLDRRDQDALDAVL